jgi:signal transduction histidine kinase
MFMAQNHTILVIDDEAEVVKSVKNLLRLDYNVLGASSADEALAILGREKVHVIMTDQRMPGTTGVQLLTHIRAEYPEAIRLLFTGYSDLRAMIDAINQGHVYRYITKPWDPDELLVIIRDACAQYDLRDERRSLMQQLKQRNTELRQSNELKMAFIKVASHEFRTPLTILVGLCKLALRDDSTDPAMREHLARIDDAAARLEKLVNQTLSMLVAEQFEGLFDPQPQQLNRMLNQAADDIRPFLQLRRQTIELQLEELGTLNVDAEKLRDALNHLLFNAVKFTPDLGKITLRARRDVEGVHIEVADTGRGIPPESMARLFEPFFTGFDVSRHSSGIYEYGASGLGLGLSVVKAFVQMHGGKVSAESQVGQGTTFRLFLPEKIPNTFSLPLTVAA